MHKIIDVKLTPVFSPVCQTLIFENKKQQREKTKKECFDKCSELLIIRLDGVIIAYSTFEVIGFTDISINSLYFRGIVKDHTLAEYWLSRYLKRYLRKNTYMHLSLDV
jgi:hypothetical protein